MTAAATADTTAVATAYWTLAPGRGALRAEPLPPPGPGELRLRSLYGAISRGTEALVHRGAVPESQHSAMRAPFQAGSFPFPVKYGYSLVARVEAGEPALLGQAVFCLHPHQDACVVPAEAVVPLPPGLPPARAVLGANAETALNLLWDAAPRLGDRIAVVGAGTVGCLAARFAAAIPGCAVTLVDIDPDKAAIAAALGLAFAAPEAAPRDCDLVLHASGAPAGLVTALGLAGFEATVVEASWFGDAPVILPLGEAFHAKRLTLLSSQVGAVAPARRARRSRRERLAQALALLAADPALEALITGECRFAALPQVIDRLAAGAPGALCQRIRYPASE